MQAMRAEAPPGFNEPELSWKSNVDLDDLCTGLLRPEQLTTSVALPAASSSARAASGQPHPQATAAVAPFVPPPPVVQPPNKYLSNELRDALGASHPALPMQQCVQASVPPAAVLMRAAAETEAEESATAGACWGGMLKRDCTACSPGFESGKAHFKNKFCANCRKGIAVDASRVRALTSEMHTMYGNSLRAGFWKKASASIGGGEVRIANNTITCDGPWLVVYRDLPPSQLPWAPVPSEWIDEDGLVRFSVAKGTLVPLAEMGRKSNSSSSHAVPGSAPKRQRRASGTGEWGASGMDGQPFVPSVRRVASAPVSAFAPVPSVGAPSIGPILAAATTAAAAAAAAAPPAGQRSGASPPPPPPHPLVMPSSPGLSHASVASAQMPPSLCSSNRSSSECLVPSPPTSPAELAAQLTMAHQRVAQLLEGALRPLSPLRQQLSPEMVADLFGQLNVCRSSLEAASRLGSPASTSMPAQQRQWAPEKERDQEPSPPQPLPQRRAPIVTSVAALKDISGKQLEKATADQEMSDTPGEEEGEGEGDDDDDDECGEGAAFTLEQLANAAAGE
jgi:hypothetical protein